MTSWARVRFTVAAVVVGSLLAGIWLIPSVASAGKQTAVHRGTTYSDEDCEALLNLDDEVPDTGSTDIFGKRAEAIGTGFKETADKIDDKKLKKALNTIAAFYDDLGDADNVIGAAKVLAKSGKSYAKATATWGKATASCAVSSVTVPSSLPTISIPITLPGGVTIPTITLPSR
jgi:hypothetical protein